MKLSRLKARAEFLAARRGGRKWAMAGLVLQARPWRDGEHAGASPTPRYGLTASRKVGPAVKRNRARRRLRALAEEILRDAQGRHDYVLIARAATVDRPYGALRADLLGALRRLGLLGAHTRPPSET